jgi:cytochrome c peroxidase
MELAGMLATLCSTAPAHAGVANPAPPARVVVDLGRKLFFDQRLSADGTISCSSCHQPAHAFSDGRKDSVGVGKRVGTRNTPSLLNIIDGEPLFWDGRRDQLSVAVLDPITNPVEMARPDMTVVTHQISGQSDYRAEFSRAFPGNQAITAEEVGQALAAFIRALPQSPTAYDRYVAGRHDALTPEATDGLRLFEGKAGCSGCHQTAGARFTDGQFHHSGVGMQGVDAKLGQLTTQAIQRNLQGSAVGAAVGEDADLSALGRFMVSHRAVDVGAFRTPSLHNLDATAPYMHDGSVKTLEEAVDTEVYYRGLSTGKPIALTVDERQHLLAFLHSLSDSSTR